MAGTGEHFKAQSGYHRKLELGKGRVSKEAIRLLLLSERAMVMLGVGGKTDGNGRVVIHSEGSYIV